MRKQIKSAEAELDDKAYRKYPELTENDAKTLVVDGKWLATLGATVHGEMDRISQSLTQRVTELAERYEAPLAFCLVPQAGTCWLIPTQLSFSCSLPI